MRPFLLLALGVVLAASAAPTALASPSALRLDLPEGILGSDATVAVNVTLVIQDFMCSEPREFTVLLGANATDGVKATFAKSNLTFTTQAHAYFAEEFRQTQTVNLSVRALNSGQLELAANFPEHERGPCLAPEGFQASSATVLVAVNGPTGAPPTPPPETTPDANATTSTSAANETSTTPTPRAPTTSGSNGPSTCSPDGGCGFISDYEAPQESGGKDAPGLGLVGALAAIAAVAFIARRKK